VSQAPPKLVVLRVAARPDGYHSRVGTKKPVPEEREPASRLIDARIKELGDWRGARLSRIRSLIKAADPEIVEEIKWRKPTNPGGVPVWSHDGIICTGETYKDNVRLTFAKGALLKDPRRLFNASLEGNALRAIVIRVDDKIDEAAFKTLIRQAAASNTSRSRAKAVKTR
jgi:hypothetical protein